jgi:asparagine synthase (glutamine-hydrolysing)
MTGFAAATAVGVTAMAALRSRAAELGAVLVIHRELAVAWQDTDSFVSSHDDGDVLVVLDGTVHEPYEQGVEACRQLHQAYGRRPDELGTGLLGDYVVLVLDRTRSRLTVLRDPVGVRPWYQARSGSEHAGASEVRSLLRVPWVDASVDEEAAVLFLSGEDIVQGRTFHRGISTLAPGRSWAWQGGQVRERSHNDWEDVRPEPGVSFGEAVERCRALLDEAVSCRVRDSPLVTPELSGGLDSSAVVGTVVRLGQNVLPGRMEFTGAGADERAYSDAVAMHWGLELVSVPPWVPDEETLAALVVRLGRPVPDPHFLMLHQLNVALLERGGSTGLTGLGGDEAFEDVGLARRVLAAVQTPQPRVLRELALQTARRPRQSWRSSLRPTLGYLRRRRRPTRPLPLHFAGTAEQRDLVLAARNRRPQRVTGVDALDGRLDNLTSGYDAFILEEAAVLGALSGRRRTHPFLDPRFVRGTYGLDPQFPVRGRRNRALEAAAFADRLPAVVRDRVGKAEFSEVFWPVQLAVGAQRVATGPLAERGWLDRDGWARLLQFTRQGAAWSALPLGRAVGLDRWLRLQG